MRALAGNDTVLFEFSSGLFAAGTALKEVSIRVTNYHLETYPLYRVLINENQMLEKAPRFLSFRSSQFEFHIERIFVVDSSCDSTIKHKNRNAQGNA